MACNLTFDLPNPVAGTTTTGDPDHPIQITVSGSVTDCNSVVVRLFGITSDWDTPEVEAAVSGTTWTATFQSNTHYPKHVACSELVKVEVECEGDAGCNASGEFAIFCRPEDDGGDPVCPKIDLLSFYAGDDCTNSIVGGYRPFHFTFAMDWANTNVDEMSILLKIWPVGDPAYTSEKLIIATPAQSTYTEADLDSSLNLLTGFEHQGTLEVYAPETCQTTITIDSFPVPDCDCDTPPYDFLQVALPDGTLVADPNNTCVEVAYVVVTAPDWVGQLAWSATDGQQAVATSSVAGAPRSVRVDLPADGTRILVMAEVGTGDCIVNRDISVARCADEEPPPCDEVPEDYALVVRDPDGDDVPPGSCVDGETATVIAPPLAGDVVWEVDGQPPTADEYDPVLPRQLTLSLPEPGSQHQVVVTVGEGDCATRIRRTIRRCECPTLTGITVAGCIPGTVTLTAQGSNLSAATDFDWDFGDGVTASTTGPTVTHPYTGDNPFTATVTMNAPENCDSAEQEVTVPVCTPPQINIDWPCLAWLIINFALMAVAAIAIVVAACLFNPVIVATGPVATWLIVVFWVALIIAIIFVPISIISFIAWMIVCGVKPNWCPIAVWIRDILATIAAASAIIGLILVFIPNAWSCGLGFLIDGGYFAILAWIADAIVRYFGCPVGQNGLIGLLIAFFRWLTSFLPSP